jgi:excinuclease ABC subunit B
MLRATGVCNGIENYSRHLDGRSPGEPPFTLLHYFPEDWVVFVDESHVSVPQVGGMYKGDRSRKETLVEHGLPAAERARQPAAAVRGVGEARGADRVRVGDALEARALAERRRRRGADRAADGAARPGDRGAARADAGRRPAGGAAEGEGEGLPRARDDADEAVAEELTNYYAELGVRVRYLHSEIDAIERVGDPARPASRRVRRAGRDQPLREGLDLPRSRSSRSSTRTRRGFLRSTTSLIQTCGRAARNVEGA